jgi:KDO2-lipid IV(A) lauroyltransferase
MAFWYALAFRAAALLPPWLRRFVARIIAWGYFVFNRTQRRGVFANLRVMKPDAARRERCFLAIRTFQQAALNLVDFFSLPSTADDDIRSLAVSFDELPGRLRDIAAGQPFCIVTGHYGHWELAGALLGLAGFTVHAIALPQSSGALQSLYEMLRTRFGVIAHDIRSGLRDILRDLPDGDVPAIVSDRDYTGSGEQVEFFGRHVSFPRGAAMICSRKRLVGIPGFLVRQQDGRFRFELGSPIRPETDNERLWIREFVADFASQYEAVARKDPTQFLNFYDYWEGTRE